MEIWINPSCSKCAVALEELQGANVEFEQRRYLDQPPTEDEMTEVLLRLGLEPWDVTRLGDTSAVQLGMRHWPQDRQRWIHALVEHPELIQRPILLLDDGTAMLGRDADAVRVAVRRSTAGCPSTSSALLEQAGDLPGAAAGVVPVGSARGHRRAGAAPPGNAGARAEPQPSETVAR